MPRLRGFHIIQPVQAFVKSRPMREYQGLFGGEERFNEGAELFLLLRGKPGELMPEFNDDVPGLPFRIKNVVRRNAQFLAVPNQCIDIAFV